ncbi:MAG TPA: hypothetical protein VNH19_04525 [Candidatus Limnocylindrales bacterium]|nr:hypothetical protein [Candidatus Limnocylindrales bacterium]
MSCSLPGKLQGYGAGGTFLIKKNPKNAKIIFYLVYGPKLNNCIESVFGSDAAKVPQQTIQNAPVLNAGYTEQQLSTMAHNPNGSVGWNKPDLGPHGTVYVASNTIFDATGPNTLNAIFGTFAHELGNILDERMNPPGTTNGQPWGGTYGNPHEPNLDWDTGQQIEDCIFGGPQYPDHP